MKQIRALRANGIVMLVSSVITAVCVGVCWKHFPIAVQVIYIGIALLSTARPVTERKVVQMVPTFIFNSGGYSMVLDWTRRDIVNRF